MKFEVKSDNAKFQTYFANKEAGDQILKVIADKGLSRQQTERLFLELQKLMDELPVISSDEGLEIEVI